MMRRFAIAAAALGSAFLVSCGGGGDIAGDSADFSVNPEEYKFTGPSCNSASQFQPIVVTIVGGQAPYRIVNSSPETLSVDKTEATGKDPQFRVSYKNTNLCSDPATITVLDYHSRVATFEYSVDVEEEQ